MPTLSLLEIKKPFEDVISSKGFKVTEMSSDKDVDGGDGRLISVYLRQ